MRQLTFVVLISVLSFFTASVYAQRFEVPDNYSFDSKEGYHKYDHDIIKCVNWLEKTPPKETNGKIKSAGDFLVEWLTGCPYVHFQQNVRIDAFMDDSPELRIYYMGGWARYALQHPGQTDKVQCSMAGIRCALKVYKENSFLERDANVDEVANVDSQGKLQAWVEDRM
jgi:hypothetical protein